LKAQEEYAALREEAELLRASAASWEDKYKARESRPDDVLRIRKMVQLVKAKDEEVRKLQEEMKYFKLELINRETNFNKMFARSPQIGVLSPTVASAPPQSGGGGGGGPLSARTEREREREREAGAAFAAPAAGAPAGAATGVPAAAAAAGRPPLHATTGGAAAAGAAASAAAAAAGSAFVASRSLTGAGASVLGSSSATAAGGGRLASAPQRPAAARDAVSGGGEDAHAGGGTLRSNAGSSNTGSTSSLGDRGFSGSPFVAEFTPAAGSRPPASAGVLPRSASDAALAALGGANGSAAGSDDAQGGGGSPSPWRAQGGSARGPRPHSGTRG